MSFKSHTIVVRVSKNQDKFLNEIVQQQQICKSQVVRSALNAYMIEKTRRFVVADKKLKIRDDD